jgi:predicted transcriptional regulator
MRRSKLEHYEEIIRSLAKNALTVDGIAFQCNTSCVTLQGRLDFLLTHNLVTLEVTRDNRAVYVLTKRGIAISKTLAITKRLEKLQTH